MFARHNVLTDPPFSRMDLVNCRNLLIYLEPPLQQQVISAMHYALKPGGVTLVGSSRYNRHRATSSSRRRESSRMYVKKIGPARPLLYSVRLAAPAPRAPGQGTHGETHTWTPGCASRSRSDSPDGNAPASVLVTGDLDIVHFRGETDRYSGRRRAKASLNLLKMFAGGSGAGVRCR